MLFIATLLEGPLKFTGFGLQAAPNQHQLGNAIVGLVGQAQFKNLAHPLEQHFFGITPQAQKPFGPQHLGRPRDQVFINKAVNPVALEQLGMPQYQAAQSLDMGMVAIK